MVFINEFKSPSYVIIAAFGRKLNFTIEIFDRLFWSSFDIFIQYITQGQGLFLNYM